MHICKDKRLMAGVLIACALVTSTLAGCGDDDEQPAHPGTSETDVVSNIDTDLPDAAHTSTTDAAQTDTPATQPDANEVDTEQPPLDPDQWLQDAFQGGPHAVAQLEFDFVDTSRGSPARGDNPATDNRLLHTTLWFPETIDQPMPVVLWAHGKGSGRLDNDDTAELLASWGYLVAAPDFPGTTRNIPGDDALQDVANQPSDLSFILDTLLTHTQSDETPWGGHVDGDTVIVGGVSLGAMTSLAIAWIPAFADPRVDAIIALAPPGCYLPRPRWTSSPVPMLVMVGTSDALLRFESQGDVPFNDAPPETSVVVTLDRGSHLGFGDISGRLLNGLDHPDALGCDTTDGQLNNEVLAPLVESLGGPDRATVEAECQVPCVGDESNGVSMRPARQGELTRAAVLTFVRSVAEDVGSLDQLRAGIDAQPDALVR
jgi:dienelactone hydrolase